MKISVIVHPNSKKERIEKDLLETLHVYVNQPPLKGKANQATIAALAEFFKTSKNESTHDLTVGVSSRSRTSSAISKPSTLPSGFSRDKVHIISGAKSKHKIFEITLQ